MIKKILLALVVIGTFALQNCKTEDPDPVPPITAPSVTLPSISGVDGILMAIITRTKEFGTDINTGTAHAVFYKNMNPNTRVGAGTLKVNQKTLIKSDDNIYYYIPTTTDPKGIDFQAQVNWQGTGNTADGVPVIDDNASGAFPSYPNLPEFITFDKDQDKKIDWVNSSAGDSIIFVLTGPSGSFKRVFPNTVTVFTVPKAEIAKLGIGKGSLQVVNFSRVDKIKNGKNYAFIRQTNAFTPKVDFQ